MHTPVAIAGLGMIGRAVARAALASPALGLVGAIDPAFAGRALGALLEVPARVSVDAEPARVFSGRPGILLHATSSSFLQVLPELEAAVRAGWDVVSTCEELAYAPLRNPERARDLDRLCKERGVRVLGTGVNPGFVLDRLPALLCHAVGSIKAVRATRVVDSSTRREALQKKTGAGLGRVEFEARARSGGFGHIGLSESAALAAIAADLSFDDIEESLEPVLSSDGRVAGIHQIARAVLRGADVVVLDLTIALGAPDPRDEVVLESDPPLRLVIAGGTAGDSATAWTVVNAARVLRRTAPGLRTVLDLPAARA